jgi:hypothetical protein
VLCQPKSTIQKLIFNPSVHATQNYNIVEYLAQAPCAMSTLEVLQNCPSQRRTLFLSIGAVDPEASNIIMFNLEYFKPRLSHHLAFQIHIIIHGKNIHRTILDEGASTCVMSLSCWRAIGSPDINQSQTTLKLFDGHVFHTLWDFTLFTHGNRRKNISIDVEVVDTPLDYNLLLGHSWFYAMTIVASSVFRLLQFPHQGKIVTIDQLDYCTPDICNNNANNIPFLGHSNLKYESVGVGLLKDSSLMGFFPLLALISHIK